MKRASARLPQSSMCAAGSATSISARHNATSRISSRAISAVASPLLSPAYLLSVERWPFHSEPPDHYVLLSHLLDLSVSQSSTLMPLHYQYDVRPYLAYLRAPPLLFGRRPPQSNCLPYTVPTPV